jgi:shikimate 5-dehydrogenase
MKWCVISDETNHRRHETLSQALKDHGIENTMTPLPATLDTFSQVLKSAQTTFDQIRIGSPFGDQMGKIGIHSTELISRIQSGDAFIKKNQIWWPKSYLFGGMVKQFNLNVKAIDLKSSVFIVGAGASSRVAIAAFSQMGFLKFHITDRDSKKGMDLVASVKKTYFNVDFQFVPQSAIMVLPGSNSVLVNTTPITTENKILLDLYYFNFLKKPSTVIDMNLYPIPTPLCKEASELGADCIHGYQIAAQVDVDWAKEVTGFDIEISKYADRLKDELSKLEFDTKPYERVKE